MAKAKHAARSFKVVVWRSMHGWWTRESCLCKWLFEFGLSNVGHNSYAAL